MQFGIGSYQNWLKKTVVGDTKKSQKRLINAVMHDFFRLIKKIFICICMLS